MDVKEKHCCGRKKKGLLIAEPNLLLYTKMLFKIKSLHSPREELVPTSLL